MNGERADGSVHRAAFVVPSFVLIALVFLAARLALLDLRQPFYDELFTVWMARQPLGNVLANLLHDSGPPLYYWIARLDSVEGLRLLSLLFAGVQFALVWRISSAAAALLALYPPAVLFAVDARAYALCALLVTAGVVALDRGERWAAAAAFLVAAYSHYYGVLFFPLLLWPTEGRVSSPGPRTAGAGARAAAFAAASAAFIPGFVLAFHQPPQATAWNREPLYAPLLNLSFGGVYPEALFPPVPLLVAALLTLLLAVSLVRSWRFAPAVLLPLLFVTMLHLAGRPVYFPMRFEAIIAGPLALWLATSLQRMVPRVRWTLLAALLGAGAIVAGRGIAAHAGAGPDPYRQAALVLRQHAAPSDRIVATGYLYLEAVVALDRPVQAWPAEQALHPGWRAAVPPEIAALPGGPFVWIGERQAPELRSLVGARRIRPMFFNDRAAIVRVAP